MRIKITFLISILFKCNPIRRRRRREAFIYHCLSLCSYLRNNKRIMIIISKSKLGFMLIHISLDAKIFWVREEQQQRGLIDNPKISCHKSHEESNFDGPKIINSSTWSISALGDLCPLVSSWSASRWFDSTDLIAAENHIGQRRPLPVARAPGSRAAERVWPALGFRGSELSLNPLSCSKRLIESRTQCNCSYHCSAHIDKPNLMPSTNPIRFIPPTTTNENNRDCCECNRAKQNCDVLFEFSTWKQKTQLNEIEWRNWILHKPK